MIHVIGVMWGIVFGTPLLLLVGLRWLIQKITGRVTQNWARRLADRMRGWFQ